MYPLSQLLMTQDWWVIYFLFNFFFFTSSDETLLTQRFSSIWLKGSYKMKSIRSCFCPGVFGIIIFFVNFGIALEKYVNLCVTELSYLGKYFSLQHEKNRPKMGIRFGFLKFLKSLGITVFDLFYNENLYYLLFLWKYLKSKKHLVPEIWRKIPSAYQLHLETKLMK